MLILHQMSDMATTAVASAQLERILQRNCRILYNFEYNFVRLIISLLMSPLLGHRPFLWIAHKENGP
jgi:hypothetical protein